MWEILRGFLEGIVGHIFANIIINYGPMVMAAIIAIWLRINKKHLWFLPLIIGAAMVILIFVADRFLPIPKPILVTGKLDAALAPLTMNSTGVINTWPTVVWKFLVITFWVGSIILALYVFKKGTSLTLALGVYWDNKLNPFCSNCKTPLSMSGAGSNILRCLNCKEDINLREGNTFYSLDDAKKAVKSLKTGESLLEIIKAEYWTTNESADVTERLKDMIVNNKLEFIVSNEILGVHPDPGKRKSLKIEYKLNGKTMLYECRERDTVVIPIP